MALILAERNIKPGKGQMKDLNYSTHKPTNHSPPVLGGVPEFARGRGLLLALAKLHISTLRLINFIPGRYQ